MLRRLLLAALVVAGALAVGCSPGTPASWAVTIDQLKSEPTAPAPDTAVTVEFRVTCRRTGGSGNNPVQVVAEVRRADAPGVVTDRISCAITGSPHEPGVFVGSGRADLGKLPAGKHAITVSLQPKGPGWALPPPQVIDVVVAGGGR